VTTNLDAERAVVLDMGAIAEHGDDRALKLFRDVLLASAGIPGLFPPVSVEAEANGRRFQESHADGATSGPFFIGPQSLLINSAKQPLPAQQLYVIVNSKLTPEFQLSERNLVSVLGGSISVALKRTTRAEMAIVRAAAERSGIGFQVAYR
jgi:predicted acylesterase/phospholipase RssA